MAPVGCRYVAEGCERATYATHRTCLFAVRFLQGVVYRMTVEFRLLGDVEARVDGRRLEIGHARQRCVLAALLVDVNQPIPVDQLVDRVWSDRPPHSARNSLATICVSAAQSACRCGGGGDFAWAGWICA